MMPAADSTGSRWLPADALGAWLETHPAHRDQLPADCRPHLFPHASRGDRQRALTPAGNDAAPLVILESRSRRLPGYRIWRLPRFGQGLRPEDAGQRLAMLARAANRERVLRCRVQLFSTDAVHRARLADAARAYGFVPATSHESYRSTLAIDLRPQTTADLFATIGSTARRHVRATEKRGLTVTTLTDTDLADTLLDMEQQTRQRTGGGYALQPWRHWLQVAARFPGEVRISALIDTARRNPAERVLAVALGLAHGDHVEYRAAASIRDPQIKTPLAYGPAWDLMVWAHAGGHDWFDFGGITSEDSPLAGISAFKQRFGGSKITVAEELVFKPDTIMVAGERMLGSIIESFKSRTSKRK